MKINGVRSRVLNNTVTAWTIEARSLELIERIMLIVKGGRKIRF